jgi:hypothetical protein
VGSIVENLYFFLDASKKRSSILNLYFDNVVYRGDKKLCLNQILRLMTTFSFQFKEADSQQIQTWLAYLRSLDFIQNLTSNEIALNKGYLSVAELKKAYPNEWLLLADTQMNELELLGGRVILRATDKRQLALQGRDLVKQYAKVRHYYAGERIAMRHIGLMVRKNQSNKPL